MLVIAGTIQIDPAKLDEAAEAARVMMKATRAEEGCEAYVFSQSLETPGLIHVFEQWKDQAALEAHFVAPHMIEFQGKMGGFGIQRMDVQKYEIAGVGPIR